MNFKQWKIGLVVAFLTGFFSTFLVSAIVDKSTTRQLIILCLSFIAKDVILYLKQNSVDKITFDSTTTTNGQVKQNTVTIESNTKS